MGPSYPSVMELWEQVLPELQLVVPFDLDENTVAVFRVGSHSHGTHVPPEDPAGVDDTDLMVVVIPPPEYVLGLKKFEHASFKHGQWDVVIYEWSKWLRMLMKQNPNVVGTLWLEPEDAYYPRLNHNLEVLIQQRDRMLSREMYNSFVGYARGQMHKMVHCAHQGYMGAKRKALVEQHGYDTKNAAHLIRLLDMAVDCLRTGTLTVRRSNAEFLKQIKRGDYNRAVIEGLAEVMFINAKDALENSPLREYPDEVFVNHTIVAGYFWHWRYR